MENEYECHITMVGDPVVLEPRVKELGWSFSKIDGDPLLGDGVKCYATTHADCNSFTFGNILDVLHQATGHLLRQGCNVVRQKIERVEYDKRFG